MLEFYLHIRTQICNEQVLLIVAVEGLRQVIDVRLKKNGDKFENREAQRSSTSTVEWTVAKFLAR